MWTISWGLAGISSVRTSVYASSSWHLPYFTQILRVNNVTPNSVAHVLQEKQEKKNLKSSPIARRHLTQISKLTFWFTWLAFLALISSGPQGPQGEALQMSPGSFYLLRALYGPSMELCLIPNLISHCIATPTWHPKISSLKSFQQFKVHMRISIREVSMLPFQIWIHTSAGSRSKVLPIWHFNVQCLDM